ncbi:MAG: methylated-DNA--[protein]-cysteine S-methyltransferase [Actinobacteria bacterium]|nr:methylated-DNA--[protein]-cysteine S-methyltransferase [Actinomycetota bacterium]MBU1944694.1 methylated-DNA--[protein]-cysteine S-methyltransferase [Actinomycetota bacterium]MBU2689242.1 methylated-DNA--[protein]-cysteine S-methyltransferase [Actinomycetota bacterium]
MKDNGFSPDAVITVRGASFAAGFSVRGVCRLVLPPLADMSPGRERGPLVRIVDRAKPGVGQNASDLARFLAEYLAGGETGVVPEVDLGAASPFTRSVLEEVRRIPWGSTASYGRMAREVGRPGAARAVGGAVSRNPVPLLVPCHRVVRGDGYAGGWSGAEGWKEWLLDLEGEAAWR